MNRHLTLDLLCTFKKMFINSQIIPLLKQFLLEKGPVTLEERKAQSHTQ